jgi:hypothetical protein
MAWKKLQTMKLIQTCRELVIRTGLRNSHNKVVVEAT